MSSVLPVLLLVLAGFLTGGVIQLIKSGATRFSVGLVGVLAVLAIVGGVAWMIPSASS